MGLYPLLFSSGQPLNPLPITAYIMVTGTFTADKMVSCINFSN